MKKHFSELENFLDAQRNKQGSVTGQGRGQARVGQPRFGGRRIRVDDNVTALLRIFFSRFCSCISQEG